MTVPDRLSGVLAPVVTPFGADLAPDAARLLRHCRWLLSQGAGLAVFGTNSEANSMSVEEKSVLLERLVGGGIHPGRMLPGTGACSFSDAVTLCRRAVALDCAGVLMLPPFYYKNVADEGLFRYYSEVIERVGDEKLKVYLYHIPPVSQVGISLKLVERLLRAWPGAIAGIKDSSGEWDNTRALLDADWDDFRVFVGSETFLLRNVRGGGAGCISATANVNPAAIRRLYVEWESADAEAQQRALDDLRNLMHRYPMIAALKTAVAHFGGDAAWRTMRPPLIELGERQRAGLVGDLEQLGFCMPGWRETLEA